MNLDHFYTYRVLSMNIPSIFLSLRTPFRHSEQLERAFGNVGKPTSTHIIFPISALAWSVDRHVHIYMYIYVTCFRSRCESEREVWSKASLPWISAARSVPVAIARLGCISSLSLPKLAARASCVVATSRRVASTLDFFSDDKFELHRSFGTYRVPRDSARKDSLVPWNAIFHTRGASNRASCANRSKLTARRVIALKKIARTPT